MKKSVATGLLLVVAILGVAAVVYFRGPSKYVVAASTQPAIGELMRIEDHGTLWLQLQLYEGQMASVAVGDEVQATVDAFPGKTFAGHITFVHPHVDQMSRTVMARSVLENSELSLRPGMYASAAIVTKPVTDAIQVPREAVIDTGTRQIAFVADAEGHFQPRIVHMGVVSDDGRVQILDGLSPGEAVVTSGQFLLDVESRTTEAVEKLRSSTGVTSNMPASDPTPMPMPAMATAMNTPTTITIRVAYCPMKKSHWLQRGDVIANPFFGTEMIDCGSVQRTVPPPDAKSPLAPLIDAYLRVEESLAADKLDADAIAALRTAAEKLPDTKFTSLQSSALAVASAADLATARTALMPLSEALLQASEASTTMPATTTPMNDGMAR